MNQEQDLNCYFENLKDVVEYLDDPDFLEEKDRTNLLFEAMFRGEDSLKSYLENNFGMKTLDFPNGGYQYYLP